MSCGYVACKECKTCEGFCQTDTTTHAYGQMVRNAFTQPILPFLGKDDIIVKCLPREWYNAIVIYLNAAASFGNLVDSGGWRAKEINGDFLTADAVSSLANHFNTGGTGLQPQDGYPGVHVNDVVYAEYFRGLINKIRDVMFSGVACHKCNLGCQTCVTRITEDSCPNCCDSA